MLEAFCCATNTNLPQLTVAVSSFMRHNPDIPVRVYCKLGTAVDPLLELGVNVERVMLANLMMSALDHLTSDPSISRAVHIGAATLTQDKLADLAQVNMQGISLAVSSQWAFAPMPDYHGWYLIEDVEGEKHREKLNPRYFGIDFMMLNLEYLRTRPRHGYLLDFIKSRSVDERDFLNLRFRDDNYLNMPGNLNVATENVIHLYLPTRELLHHHSRMTQARVARFPGSVVPWERYGKFDRVSMQLPMVEYARATQRVDYLLPAEFLASVDANLQKTQRYLGRLPEVMPELRKIATN